MHRNAKSPRLVIFRLSDHNARRCGCCVQFVQGKYLDKSRIVGRSTYLKIRNANSIETRRRADFARHDHVLQLSEILAESFGVPTEAAHATCGAYLRAFRKCPDNPSTSLDAWRHLLWTQALGDQYGSLAGEVYVKWLQLRYYYLTLTPDVVALLGRLHAQYMLGLITNGPSAAQWEKIERLNLKSYFDVILVSGDLPWEKPQQQIFHEACEFLGVEPRQCLMVGDKLETDILGGIHAQLGATVWIPPGGGDGQVHEIDPDYTIQKVTDLPTLLPKRAGKLGALRTPKSIFNRRNRNLDLDDCNSNGSDGS